MKNFPLDWQQKTWIMGIINLTPDSFSGDGLLSHASPLDAALAQAAHFVDEGVDILDVGGESTRPGAASISAAEEINRVVPVIQALSRAFPDIILSVDTCKSAVAHAALNAGADWVNDIWGLKADPLMAQTIAAHHAPVVLMHNRMQANTTQLREKLGGRYVGVDYQNLLADVKLELMESVLMAREAGIGDDHIMLDPGIGFGKTVEQNLTLLNHLDDIKGLGFPILLGVSRKSVIGYTLDLPPAERLEGTLAAGAVGILRGANILRVHDVQAHVRLAHMTDAILRA